MDVPITFVLTRKQFFDDKGYYYKPIRKEEGYPWVYYKIPLIVVEDKGDGTITVQTNLLEERMIDGNKGRNDSVGDDEIRSESQVPKSKRKGGLPAAPASARVPCESGSPGGRRSWHRIPRS